MVSKKKSLKTHKQQVLMSLTFKVLAKTEESEIVFTGKILCWSNHPTFHWYQCHILYIIITDTYWQHYLHVFIRIY